nr:hypothetical protein [uncultured Dyadobacter sp.]
MRHTFHISADHLNEQFMDSIRSLFAHSDVKVTVEDLPTPAEID